MKMLIVGAGVIGTVYGAHVAAAGSKVSVLSHGSRTGEVAAAGLSARDVLRGRRVDAEADVVPDAPADRAGIGRVGARVRGPAGHRHDGWLAYHAAFIACVAAALYRCGTDPVRLAADRATLTLMCRAITGAFAALRTDGTAGLPRNLAVLHSPPLRAVAVRYWARTMRLPTGELCFAAHSRHAEAEMRALGQDVAARITSSPALTELLRPLPHQLGHANLYC